MKTFKIIALTNLRQVEHALSSGERASAVRYRLETIEAEMDSIQRHLIKLFDSRLKTRIKHGNIVGYSDIEESLPGKIEDLQKLLREHRLAGWTRVGALQMLSEYPGELGLKTARSKAVEASATTNDFMCKQFEQVMSFEVSQWTGRTESVLTNVLHGQSKVQKWVNKAVLPKSLQSKNIHESLIKEKSESSTPILDTLKRTSLSMIQQASRAEVRSAGRFLIATTAVDGILHEVEAPKRYLVEWEGNGPKRVFVPDSL